jgi:hypothetical protein
LRVGRFVVSERPKRLTINNWAEFTLEDLPLTEEERTWNRYAVLKQLEINTMMASLKGGLEASIG